MSKKLKKDSVHEKMCVVVVYSLMFCYRSGVVINVFVSSVLNCVTLKRIFFHPWNPSSATCRRIFILQRQPFGFVCCVVCSCRSLCQKRQFTTSCFGPGGDDRPLVAVSVKQLKIFSICILIRLGRKNVRPSVPLNFFILFSSAWVAA